MYERLRKWTLPFPMILGQAVVIAVCLILLIGHLIVTSMAIDLATFGLLGAIALALVLPRLTDFTANRSGVSVKLSDGRVAADALAKATSVAGDSLPSGNHVLAGASNDPAAALEAARRSFGSALLDLATARKIQPTSSDLAEIAHELSTKNVIDVPTLDACTALAKVFAISAVTPALAYQAGLATEILVGRLRMLASEAS